MTERTIKDVRADINAVQKKIDERAMIVGPVWNRSIVSFSADDGIKDEPYTDWSDKYDKYQRGETLGEVVVNISTTGCDGDARLDSEMFLKISQVKRQIYYNELRELQRLRKERAKLNQIAEAQDKVDALKGLAPSKKDNTYLDQVLESL
jgi:hypothetical protein